MKTKFKSSVTLQRSDDRGESVDTTIEYIRGMPSVLLISQTQNGRTSRISMTMPETDFFRYVLAEFNTFNECVKNIERKDEDDDDSDRSLRIGGGGGLGIALRHA